MQPNQFRRIWAGFGGLLFLVTWRLWIPQATFPQIPFVAALVNTPRYVDWLAILAITAALLLIGFSTADRVWRIAMVMFAVAATLLVLLNQHRFQPWTYQFVIFAVIMAGCRDKSALRLMRWVTVSIYIYSAVSKFDYQFLHSLGPQFVATLTSFIGIRSADWREHSQVAIAVLLPLTELLVGIGLLVPRTRQAAAYVAIGLHTLLLLILGPWGLSHQPGVLVWNLFFIAQAWVLFGRCERDAVTTQSATRELTRGEMLSYLLAGIVIVLPASEPLGYCDHWAAWELYSPRSSRAQVAIHESVVDRLPTEIQEQLSPAIDRDDWQQLPLDRWSLDSLSVPIYPEDRFQIGVALAAAERYDLRLAILVTRQSASDRWTGERATHSFVGHDQLTTLRSDFLLSIDARPIWSED